MVHCSVNGCNSSNDRRLNRVKDDPDLKNLHFYRFPRKRLYVKAWETVCARNGKLNTKNAYICSRHFNPDDYARNLRHELLNYCPINSKKLKADAIPTLNTPNVIRVPEELNESKVSALPILNRIPTAVPTNVVKPKIKVISPEKLGISAIQTKPASAAKVSQACAAISPDMIIVENLTQCKEGDCLAYFMPTGIASLTYKAPQRKNTWNLEEPGTKQWNEVQFQFLNHVVMVLVNRCRNGNPNIVMLDSMLKKKAEEAAKILDTPILYPRKWLQTFKDKLRLEDARQPKKFDPNVCNLSKNIADIIDEEWIRFRCEGYHILSQRSQVEESADIEFKEPIERKEDREAKASIQSNVKALVPDEPLSIVEDWNSPIESYLEALECLTLVENYAFSVRNLSAVSVITDLEIILRLECQ